MAYVLKYFLLEYGLQLLRNMQLFVKNIVFWKQKQK